MPMLERCIVVVTVLEWEERVAPECDLGRIGAFAKSPGLRDG